MRYGCLQCREELALGPPGALPPLSRARHAAHLAACPECRTHAARYASAVEAARAWAPVLTAERRDAILDRVHARTERVERRPARWPFAAGWLALTATAAVVVLVLRAPERSTPPAPRDAPPARTDAVHPAAPAEPSAGNSRLTGQAPARGPGHARREAARDARPSPLPSPPATLPSGDSRRGGALYTEAEHAMAEGRTAAAARILEELVEVQPESGEAQAARLELGRLYAGPLAYPSRAVVHLSAFVAREPEPIVRGAAKGLLCRLLTAPERDRICWPGVAALGEPRREAVGQDPNTAPRDRGASNQGGSP